MTRAKVRTQQYERQRKSKKQIEQILRDEEVDVEVLLGNGKAKVGATAIYRRGADFNSFVFGLNCWVELSCNQDNETIALAQDAATDLAAAEIARNQHSIDSIVDAVERPTKEES